MSVLRRIRRPNEQRYKTGDTPWEKGEASPGLIDFLRETPPPVKGSVLVPAADSVATRVPGLRLAGPAVGLDIAPSAVAAAREATPKGVPAEFRLAISWG